MNNPSDRRKFIELINEAHAAGAGLSACCKTLGIDFKSYQRWSLSPDREDQRTKAARAKAPPRAPSRRALSAEERAAIVDRYCQADVVDLSLTQAYYTILDKGEYYGSLRTVYRVMSAAQLNLSSRGEVETTDVMPGEHIPWQASPPALYRFHCVP